MRTLGLGEREDVGGVAERIPAVHDPVGPRGECHPAVAGAHLIGVEGHHEVAAAIGVRAEGRADAGDDGLGRSEEHTSELQSLMRISYAVFCLTNKLRQRSASQITTSYSSLTTITYSQSS